MRLGGKLAAAVLLVMSCGGGGGDSTGFLDVFNNSNRFNGSGCLMQIEVRRPDSSNQRFDQVPPCGVKSFRLPTGHLERVRGRKPCLHGSGRIHQGGPEERAHRFESVLRFLLSLSLSKMGLCRSMP